MNYSTPRKVGHDTKIAIYQSEVKSAKIHVILYVGRISFCVDLIVTSIAPQAVIQIQLSLMMCLLQGETYFASLQPRLIKCQHDSIKPGKYTKSNKIFHHTTLC